MLAGKQLIKKGVCQGVRAGGAALDMVGGKPSPEVSTTEVKTENVLRKLGGSGSVLLGVLVRSG